MKRTKTHILMLDSQESLTLATKKYFTKYGINVTFTNSSTDLLKILVKNSPDCLVIDPLTEPHNSEGLIQKLKTNEKTQAIPIIILTAKGLTQDRIKGYSNGCESYVSKPFDPEELYSIIKNLLRHRDYATKHVLKNYLLIKDIKLSLLKKLKTQPEPRLKVVLTEQEIHILDKLLAGQTIKQLKSTANTSQRNIEKYVKRILDKINVRKVEELKYLPWESILLLKKANDGNRTRE